MGQVSNICIINLHQEKDLDQAVIIANGIYAYLNKEFPTIKDKKRILSNNTGKNYFNINMVDGSQRIIATWFCGEQIKAVIFKE